MRSSQILDRTLSRRAAVSTGIVGIAASPLIFAASSTLARQQATPAPSGVGLSQALDALDSIVADAMGRTGVPGVAVTVVSTDDTLAARGYGVASTETGAPVDADTIFQLASLSKPLASTVVASIVGEGLVTWHTPVVDHYPDFALHEPWPTSQVTIADLFSHRSGLADHPGDVLENLGYYHYTVLHRLRYLRPKYSFRDGYGYAYTNFGLTAGAIAAMEIGRDLLAGTP